VIFRQIVHDDLGCASYLVGDHRAGVAAVVDPRWDVDVYLELARGAGVTIVHVLETHNHADHISGHGRLAAATGATIHIHRAARPVYAHEPFDDGWELTLGTVAIRALHTGGHRPEHTAFVLIDAARGPLPWAVLTGDSLLVNDVARPDLAVEAADGARATFRSLRERLLALPDEVEVWPGHLGGSLCGGAQMDMKPSSTIGYEKRYSPALSIEDEDAFVARAIAQLGPQPPNFLRIVERNTGPLRPGDVHVTALAPAELASRQGAGALVIDLRTAEEFAEAHVPGALCVPFGRAGFGSKLAWLVNADQDVVLVGRDDADARRAARLATAVAVDGIAGCLGGGMTSWREERRPVERIERLSIDQLPARRDAEPSLQVLDVRECAEWAAGHIPGSRCTPWHELHSVPEGVDLDAPIAVVCASGQRAATGASLLQRHGARRAIQVDGGVTQWERLGHELVRCPPTATT
jgi:hydroxyacylglutathione hydrolase